MELTFVDVLKIVSKRIGIVIAVTVLAVAVAVSYCVFLAKPVYSANATVLIASGALFKDDDGYKTNAEYITTGELSTSFALMKSFSGILTESVEYYEKALETAEEEGLNIEYDVKSLSKATRINFEEESIILDITVSTYDKEDSEVLIASLAKCAPEIITSKLGRTSAVVLNVDTDADKVSPNTVMLVLIALIVGFMLAVVLVTVIEKLDKTVKDEEDFTNHHNVPLLGSVPDFESKGKRRLID